MAPRFFKPTGRPRVHRKGFSPREILSSDMSNDLVKDPKYREHAWGGESHAYYDGHDARTVPNKVWMQQNSPVVQTDENGNRFVEMFHWTNPANVPSILKSGLAESLGPDAGRWQARKGVWTSYGDRNPMSYDYVNNKRINENGFNQVPLKIRIPEDEYNGMRVDHTGQTFDDNVAVFRAPRDARYGTISFKEAGTGKERKEKVAIPPQYISEYQLPESWSMKGLNERGTHIPAYTYPGWRPGMKNAQLPNFNLFGLNRALGGDRIEHNGVINAFNEDEYRALDLASRQLNENIRKSPKKAKQVYLGLYKDDLTLTEALKGKLPSDFGVKYGFKGNKSGKEGEPDFARRLPMMAREEKYLSPYTRIKSPYELAAKWNFPETQPNEKLSEEQREDLVKRWKEQRSLDSLDRVIGHHYGRKVGKYRASRGKYGLDK